MASTDEINQKRFFESRRSFFSDVTKEILRIVPKAVSIHCFGLNVTGPRICPTDWDFMVSVPASVPATDVDYLNRLTSPLGEFRHVGSNRLEVQVISENDQSPCANLVRREGVVIWRKPSEGAAA
ncbi:hypothetical protein [Marinobacter sp.]|uniref:hypothetical protein n=1 Tax=Marinobacter sp. TaxID=50741 RepID=UPI003A94C080